MKLTAAPFLGSDIGYGFCEVPAVAVKILSVVLALAVRVVCRLAEDDGSILPRALRVALSILDTDLNDMRVVRRRNAFRDRETAFACLHLNTMVTDTKPDSEAKGL